jgi:hypothetical protein
VRGQRVEIAGTPPVAVAGDEDLSGELPVLSRSHVGYRKITSL